MLEASEPKTRVQLGSDSQVLKYDKGQLTIKIKRTGADQPEDGTQLNSVYCVGITKMNSITFTRRKETFTK